MNIFDKETFLKRYDKFKDNNLPTPFWDSERNTLEYVWFNNDYLNVSGNLLYSIETKTKTGLYYSFNSLVIRAGKKVVCHHHAHSFEDVLKNLYNYPESFNISKSDEKYYSKQELAYLIRVKKYLLFIGLKDLTSKTKNTRYKNSLQNKYSKCAIYRIDYEKLKLINDGTLNFLVWDYFDSYVEKNFKPGEYQALLVDDKDNFLYLVEFTKSELKEYKDIKKDVMLKNKKDNSKLVLNYFKILKRYI